MHKLSSISYQIDVLKMLVIKEWIIKYKSTLLGYIWSIAHPLLLAVVFYVAFKVVVKVPIENYTLFLVVGLFPWQWFMNSVSVSTWSFVANAPLIKKTLFPKYLLPLSSSILDMLHFLISIPVILVILYMFNYSPFRIEWLYQIPLMILLQLALGFSFGLIFGTLNVFYRDIDRIVSLLLTLMMYLTPIFYKLDMVPKELKSYFYLNPMVAIIELWRMIFMDGVIDINLILITLAHIVVWLSIGIVVYKKLSLRFAENL
jgi:lipopolysaccharide transport system permease protein